MTVFGTSTVFEYDAQYNAYSQKADFPGGKRAYAAGFAIGSKGYFGTGLDENGNAKNDFWEFDPEKNTWTKKADFAGAGRGRAVGFTIGSAGYIGTGTDNTTVLADFYKYDPTADAWEATTAIPAARREAYVFVVNNRAYVGGGRSSSSLRDLQMFNPDAKTWTAKTGIPNYSYTCSNASFALGTKGFVGLGYDVSRSPSVYSTQDVFEYNVSSNSWKPLRDYGGIYRSESVGFAIGNVGFFGLGAAIARTHTYRDFWAYMP